MNAAIPSFTKSKVEDGGDFLKPTCIISIKKSLSGTTSPSPSVCPYFVRKGTLVPLRYEIVSSKN